MVGAVALLLGLVAVFFAGANLVFQVRAEPATGSVVSLETLKDDVGAVRVPVRYSVKIRFTDVNGDQVEFVDPRPSGEPPAIGDDVPVLYDPAEPTDARIRDYLVMYREAVEFGVAALLAGIVAEELIRRREELPVPPEPADAPQRVR